MQIRMNPPFFCVNSSCPSFFSRSPQRNLKAAHASSLQLSQKQEGEITDVNSERVTLETRTIALKACTKKKSQKRNC